MQKIKIGHRTKFRDRDNFFPQVLFPFRAILRPYFYFRCFDRNFIHSADACFLVMACVSYSRAQLKTLSSLLNTRVFETRTATGREHIACQDSGVSQVFILILFNGENILSYVNVVE